MVRVLATRTRKANVPAGYDASKFPAFAVTVDVVILTMAEGALHMLLVQRGQKPFKGKWAIPGGFKRPEETLNEAARRELSEETGVDVPSLLTQFGAYGDPGRDSARPSRLPSSERCRRRSGACSSTPRTSAAVERK